MRCLSTYTGIGLRNTLCDHLLVAFLVASISTVLALIAYGIKQKLIAKGTQDNLVKLTLYEFVPIHFVYFVLPLAYGTLASETGSIEGALAYILLD